MEIKWIAIAASIFFLSISAQAIGVAYVDNTKLKEEIKMLKEQQNQNLMVWQMDKSCYDQFKNNLDNAIFLKLSTKNEK